MDEVMNVLEGMSLLGEDMLALRWERLLTWGGKGLVAMLISSVGVLVLKLILHFSATRDESMKVAGPCMNAIAWVAGLGILFGSGASVGVALLLLHLGVMAFAIDNRHPWGAVATFLFPGVGDISYLLYNAASRPSHHSERVAGTSIGP
jgi:hypothetical protein